MDDASDANTVVVVICDPGVPTRRVGCIRDRLEAALAEQLEGPVTLVTRTDVIRLRSDNSLDIDMAHQISANYVKVDVAVLLTEMPRHSYGDPLVGEVFPTVGLAVVACPTLGPWATKRRLVRIVSECAARAAADDQSVLHSRGACRWTRWTRTSDQDKCLLLANRVSGGVRTVLGMVVTNEPLKTIPRMSRALAAAAAVGAFGIFYSSIWQMSSYLSIARLVGIGVLAICLMVLWLLFGYRLWDRPARDNVAVVVLFYNLSTAMTLLVCVAALYLSLFLVTLAGALAVIDPGYLRSVVGQGAGFANYLEIAWLSATMGVVAGGLGTGFDSHTDLRRLTHGRREQQRRHIE